jgi:hypothetical protein
MVIGVCVRCHAGKLASGTWLSHPAILRFRRLVIPYGAQSGLVSSAPGEPVTLVSPVPSGRTA